MLTLIKFETSLVRYESTVCKSFLRLIRRNITSSMTDTDASDDFATVTHDLNLFGFVTIKRSGSPYGSSSVDYSRDHATSTNAKSSCVQRFQTTHQQFLAVPSSSSHQPHTPPFQASASIPAHSRPAALSSCLAQHLLLSPS